MPKIISILAAAIVAFHSSLAASADGFSGPVGLQLYSLRSVLKSQGPAAVLDQARLWGFKFVEVSDTGGLTPAQYRAELDKRGITPLCKMFPYDRLQNDLDAVIAEAKAFRLKYVGCGSIPHNKSFDAEQCRAAAAVFQRAGKAFAEHGMKFYYHNHAFEFADHADGTLFDLLATETDPRLVFFEIDVFWVAYAGRNPAKLIETYRDRCLLVHLKDLKNDAPAVRTAENAAENVSKYGVAVGSGQIDWPAVLRACKNAGVKCYFIEDESPRVMEQVPQSLRFLEQVKVQ
jgi:sugar phosphate isomerase/epimerase